MVDTPGVYVLWKLSPFSQLFQVCFVCLCLINRLVCLSVQHISPVASDLEPHVYAFYNLHLLLLVEEILKQHDCDRPLTCYCKIS